MLSTYEPRDESHTHTHKLAHLYILTHRGEGTVWSQFERSCIRGSSIAAPIFTDLFTVTLWWDYIADIWSILKELTRPHPRTLNKCAYAAVAALPGFSSCNNKSQKQGPDQLYPIWCIRLRDTIFDISWMLCLTVGLTVLFCLLSPSSCHSQQQPQFWQTRKSTPTSSAPFHRTTLWTPQWWSFSPTTTGAVWGPSHRMSRGSQRSVFLYISSLNRPDVTSFAKETWDVRESTYRKWDPLLRQRDGSPSEGPAKNVKLVDM